MTDLGSIAAKAYWEVTSYLEIGSDFVDSEIRAIARVYHSVLSVGEVKLRVDFETDFR